MERQPIPTLTTKYIVTIVMRKCNFCDKPLIKRLESVQTFASRKYCDETCRLAAQQKKKSVVVLPCIICGKNKEMSEYDFKRRMGREVRHKECYTKVARSGWH